MRSFYAVLGNNLAANIVNFTVWFALTFWVYLETRSVFATGMIAGVYLVMTAACGMWFGSLVDHHRKKTAMLGSSLVSLALYTLSLALCLLAPPDQLRKIDGPLLWTFIVLVMIGVIAGNVRAIALPTLVTVLVPADRRDKANGLVGMVTGVGFLTTSVISGFLVARGGMVAALTGAILLSLLAAGHLGLMRLKEPDPSLDGPEQSSRAKRMDLIGTIKVVRGVPGLFALIFFAAMNNLLGGVYMALLDAYGLSLMRVEAWGVLWAFVSLAFILSGVLISRTGLGRNPLRTLLIANLIAWTTASVFTVQSSIALLAGGCFIWMFLGPYAEAAEHTTLQKVVPFERQGRVFGLAQSIEQAASPVTAFLIGPLTQFVFVPLMTTGAGAAAIGDWFGRGPERGIAAVFTLAGVLGAAITILAFNSRPYRQLSAHYGQQPA